MHTKVLMVCLGNICRSPLAEGILRSKLDPEKFDIQSVGTGDYHTGKPPDPRSVAVAKEHGIDITEQRAATFSPKVFDDFDLIYVMDNTNYENVIALARNQKERDKVSRILDSLYPQEFREVPDPYYGGESGFEKVYALLDRACDHIATMLKSQN